MSFTAKDIAELRKSTGVGMMKCKEALTECNGDIEEAINYLRKKGIAGAAKKVSNVAAEGIVAAAVAEDKKSCALIELNCQTDFVAKNEDFQAFAKQIAKLALDTKSKSIEELLKQELNGSALSEVILEQISKIGEKLDLRRLEFVEASSVLAAYIHPVGSKLASVIALAGDSANEEKATDLAMHVAAVQPSPQFISKDDVPAEEVEAEKKIEMEKEDLAGKPDEIKEKIVAGRIGKVLAAKTLLEQEFIKDSSIKVKDYLAGATVESFKVLRVGEGVEKKEDNFADEVASMMK